MLPLCSPKSISHLPTPFVFNSIITWRSLSAQPWSRHAADSITSAALAAGILPDVSANIWASAKNSTRFSSDLPPASGLSSAVVPESHLLIFVSRQFLTSHVYCRYFLYSPNYSFTNTLTLNGLAFRPNPFDSFHGPLNTTRHPTYY